MFGQLVVLPVPADLTGEITTLEPAGESPGVVMDDSVILQLGDLGETFPADVANMFLQVLSAVFGHQMILKLENILVTPALFCNKETAQGTLALMA